MKLAVSAVRGMAGGRKVTNERETEVVDDEREEEALSADERYRPDRVNIGEREQTRR